MKKELRSFLVSKVFFKNILIAVGILFLLIILTSIGLRIYTKHGQSFQLPNFTGMSMQEVKQLANQKKLRIVINDSVYIESAEKGSVLEQYPEAGFLVKDNRKVFLTTCSYYPELIKMPKAYEVPYRQALQILERAGLELDHIEYEPYFAQSYVLKQKYQDYEIEPGSPIAKGSRIVLVVGKGSSGEKNYVPKLYKMTVDSAKTEALNHHFNLGAIKYDPSILNNEDSMRAVVYKQSPDFKNQNKIGIETPIHVWLTIDSLKLMEIDSLEMVKDSLDNLNLDIANEANN